MKAWNCFFSLLQKKVPTEDEISKAREVAKTAVEKHIMLVENETPKVHVAGVHAAEQYLRVRPGLVRLLIEHFVERNHQVGWNIEKQFHHVPQLERRANYTAGKLHKANNPDIKQKITKVHEKIRRGEYKKRTSTSRSLSITPSPPRRHRPNELVGVEEAITPAQDAILAEGHLHQA